MKAKDRRFTSKQMGDACEMLIAAELTLAGVPSMKGPDNWPGYDVIAQPSGAPPQRISVKSRHFKRGSAFFEYNVDDQFDWLAVPSHPMTKPCFLKRRANGTSRARLPKVFCHLGGAAGLMNANVKNQKNARVLCPICRADKLKERANSSDFGRHNVGCLFLKSGTHQIFSGLVHLLKPA